MKEDHSNSMERHRLGLKVKTILGLGGLVLAALLISGGTTYWQGMELAERSTLSRAMDKTVQLTIGIEAELTEARNALMIIRDTPPVQAIIRTYDNSGIDPLTNDNAEMWSQRLEKTFHAFLSNIPAYHQIRYLNENGHEIARADSDGSIVRIIPKAELQDKSTHDYFKRAIGLKNGKIYYSDLNLNREYGQIQNPHTPMLRIATPVYDASQRARGVIVINIFGNSLIEKAHSHTGEERLYAVNEHGYFLHHPDKSKEYGFDLGFEYTIKQELPNIVGSLRMKRLVVQTDSNNKNVTSFKKVFFDPENHNRYWALIQDIPASEVFRDVWITRNMTLLTSLLIILISLLIIPWFVSRRIVTPIVKLAETAERMREGDLSVRLDEALVKDEFRTLYKTINTFAEIQQRETERLEQEVAERTEHLTCVVNNLMDGLITIDEKGIIVSFNPSAEQIFGYQANEVIGNNVNMLMPEPHKKEHDGHLAKYLKTGEARVIGFVRELEGRRKDGSLFPIELSVAEMIVGGIRKFSGLVRDITARKKIEEEIHQKNTQLEQANRMKSEFLANMSHELRTPLNAIIGFSEVLKDGVMGDLSDEQKEYSTDIFNSGQHLLSLINDILDLSKIEAGKMELDIETVDVAEMLNNSLSIIKEKALSHRIALKLDMAKEIASCVLDSRKVKQILYNLLSNAVKFTSEDGRISVAAKLINGKDLQSVPTKGPSPLSVPSRLDMDFIEISVSDTGIGISEENQSRLFRAFTQADGGLNRKYEGTGLGLVMVKKLAELHGGAVGLTSEPGKGSTFTVWLPYRKSAALTASGRWSLTGLETTPQEDSGQLILIVEDDDNSAELIRIQLEKSGYRTHRAASAEQALEILAELKPDLITLDILLPGMDGWDFLTEIKKHKEFSHIPVVIVSIAADEKRGFSLGASQVLRKPVGKLALLSALRDVSLLHNWGGANVRVLVVDDDPKGVEIVSRHLEGDGHSVYKAYGGAEAIDMALREKPDMIILDLMMPEVSGFDVVNVLKESPETKGIPIIILTAKIITSKDRKILNGDVLSIVEKSGFSHAAFISEVHRAIGNPPIKGTLHEDTDC